MIEVQILTVAQMQAAEQAIFDTGTSVSELMEVAAGGAAEWVRRIAAGRSITVLCGPGNNGGDGYVIARRLREFGHSVQVVAPSSPKTDAARKAKEAWGREILTSGGAAKGDVFVDCLFGSGLTRPLSGEHALLVRDLADRHAISIAIDLPSGIESDSGLLLNDRLPRFDATLALGAWKFAHWWLPSQAMMGSKRLVPIGVGAVECAASVITRPNIAIPARDAHKYTRGLAAVVGGSMPGAARLAAAAAQRGGAGYVKLLPLDRETAIPSSLVQDVRPLDQSLDDPRIAAILAGCGLGRDNGAVSRLEQALSANRAIVLDADALHLINPAMLPADATVIATPHDGELQALCRTFSVIAEDRSARVQALSRASGMVILAKGPNTLVAAPDGRLSLAPPATSWLSVAGSGDVLAGIVVSRLASGRDPFEAACEAVWLHAEAARLCDPAFTPEELAHAVSRAFSRCV